MKNTYLPEDLEDEIRAFHVEVSSIFDNRDFPLELICNMDKTPVYLDLLPGKFVDKKSRKRASKLEQLLLKKLCCGNVMLCCFWEDAPFICRFQRKNTIGMV